MTKQYIGARYVPIIDGEYNSEKVYEPLTVVTYNGSSYTSKKSVPAGTLPTNTVYWALTGNYNAQVEEYREAVEELSTQTTEHFESLEGSLERHALVFGNSYAAGVGSPTNAGIFERIKGLYTSAKLYYGSGTGFTAYESGHANDTFNTQLLSAISDTSYDHTKITDIVILGAWGESREMAKSGYETFINNVLDASQAFVTAAKNAFPALKDISYSWCEARNFSVQSMYDIDNHFSSAYLVNRAMAYICPRVGIRYLGYLSWNINFRSGFFSADAYHPNDYGYEAISNAFIAAKNGSFHPSTMVLPITEVDASEWIPNAKFGIGYTLTPDSARIRFSHISMNNIADTYTVPDPDTYVRCAVFSKLRDSVSTAWIAPFVNGNMAKTCASKCGQSSGDISTFRIRGYWNTQGTGFELRCDVGLSGVKSTTQLIIPVNIETEAELF